MGNQGGATSPVVFFKDPFWDAFLFLIYVNKLQDVVFTTAKIFAYDTTVYDNISCREDCNQLQSDLNSLSPWSITLLLKCNALKCVVVTIRQSLNYIYTPSWPAFKNILKSRPPGEEG